MIKNQFPRALASFLLLSLTILPFAEFFSPTVALASTSTCTPENTVMSVVAHEDDTLIFQNPDVAHYIQSGKCVRTVFLTAGDAALPAWYWLDREDGAKAAYAEMAGVSNVWDQSDAGISGHVIPVFTLTGNTKVSLVFLRLPDGNIDGSGFNGNGSLQGLWTGSISSMTTFGDGSSSYTKEDLINTLAALMADYQPARIDTQDYSITFADEDHSDHIATAYFTKSAHQLYMTPHTIYAYKDYLSGYSPANVIGDDLTSKLATFFTYTPFDENVCQSYEECAGPYADWLNRQYVSASESGGQVADSCPNLDGIQTAVPNGYQLVGGQCVVKPEICESVVSDTGDMVATGTPAVPTFVSPLWTAGPNIPGATWIWNAFHVADPANGGAVTFTKQITVTGAITSASLVIAADDNYQASFNGAEFVSIDDVNNYSAGNEDTYDVTPFLHSGLNTLSVTVFNVPSSDTNPESNPAGLRYKLDIVKNSCDVTAPTISNASSTLVSTSNATVTWDTDEPATSQVEYGTSTGYGMSTTLDTATTTTHIVHLTGLTAGTLYHFRVKSADSASNTAVSDDQTFTTLAAANTAPRITLNGSASVNLFVGDTYVEAGAVATDTEDGTIVPMTSGAVNTSVAGTYTVTYTATDSGGLSASVSRTVNVVPKSTGGGGGGSYVPPRLVIGGQASVKPSTSGQVSIKWTTSTASYGHIIYGIDTGVPYTLDLTKSNFGYAQSVPTDPGVSGHLDPQGKVRNHSFILTGLIPGKTYRYRVVTHASPAVASQEGTFVASTGATEITVDPVMNEVPSSAGLVLGVEKFIFENNLQLRSRGNDVVELQKVLRTEGFFTYPTNTGYFGPLTKAALVAYQKKHDIAPAYGYFGPLTRGEMNKN